jgi:predicted HTH transcriptional regulator
MDLKFSGDRCLNEEDKFFEAKSANAGVPASLWETYSSFANSFGGTIVLGLEEIEDGTLWVRGIIDTDKAVKEIWNTVNNPQKVSCNILRSDDVKIVEHNGRRLVVISVPRADRHDCPIYINDRINGGTFRRNGPNDYRCTKPEIAGMMRESADVPLDAFVPDGFSMEDIDSGTLSRYRTFMRAGDEKHIWNTLPDYEFLRMTGAAKKGKDGELRPTLAGLLMFGNEYRITAEVPDYKLDYIEYMKSGVTWEYRIVSGDGRWTGNIFDFYLNVVNRLGMSTGRPFATGGDWRRIEDTDIDKALRESLINALVHADHRGRMGVRIEVQPNVVTVRNPGLFRIPIREAEEGGRSDPRNPTIAKMFSLVGLVERAGSGLYRIMETWKGNGLEPPLIEESLNPPTVKLTLSMKMDPKTSFVSDEEKILRLMAADGSISIEKISAEIGLSKSKTVAVVRKLRESGRLDRTGGKKGGRWIVSFDTRL